MILDFYQKNISFLRIKLLYAALICFGFSASALALVPGASKALFDKDKVALISAKIGNMAESLSGDENSEALLLAIKASQDKLAQACDYISEKQSSEELSKWRFFQIELRRTIFKLGESVAAHPEKDSLLLDFWPIFREISEVFAWQNLPKLKEDLFNRMLWVEFKNDPVSLFVSDIVKGVMGFSAVIFVVCKLREEYRKIIPSQGGLDALAQPHQGVGEFVGAKKDGSFV